MIPTNWPNNITYSNIQSFMGFKNLRKDFIPGVKIEKINDPNSILYNQFGLFSTIEFDKFDIIGQYTGKLVNEFQGGVYVASSNKCCIDAINIGNELRFINDYRNISDNPNVTIRKCYIDKKPRVMFVVTKQINIGEQLLTDYGDDYWKCLLKESKNKKNE